MEQLSTALEQAGLGWLVREVSAAIQEGRPQKTVKVRGRRNTPRLLPAATDESEPRRSTEHTRTDPYSREEQMRLLTDAIEGLFADSASLNRELVSEFGAIEFRSEDRLGEEPTFTIANESVVIHSGASERVSKLLQMIRERAGI